MAYFLSGQEYIQLPHIFCLFPQQGRHENSCGWPLDFITDYDSKISQLMSVWKWVTCSIYDQLLYLKGQLSRTLMIAVHKQQPQISIWQMCRCQKRTFHWLNRTFQAYKNIPTITTASSSCTSLWKNITRLHIVQLNITTTPQKKDY